MRFGALGPLLVVDDDGVVRPVAAARHRTVLALLLLRANRVMSFDELAEAVWDAAPPPGHRATLRNYVKLLRQRLGPAGARLRTQPPGYRLDVGPGELDLDDLQRLRSSGRALARAGQWGGAAAALTDALGLFRGPVLADVAAPAVQRDWAPRLEEVRREVWEARIDAELRLGRHEAVIDDLQRLVQEDPLRERFWLQLMQARHRSGHRAAALAVYRQARAVLAAELGLEPGPELRRLQHRILTD
ncbi:BTAD domain-containing putative transcriptional regulator [Dactylosporangium sp. NPDC051541]|uniref:AfsR/SARP family transcriptional regulator n=1 Tax=Dactylosporangium sp. NPDC051541 TaxID=3363977 RepID=UPI00378E217D